MPLLDTPLLAAGVLVFLSFLHISPTMMKTDVINLPYRACLIAAVRHIFASFLYLLEVYEQNRKQTCCTCPGP